jgi:hypothetical protein
MPYILNEGSPYYKIKKKINPTLADVKDVQGMMFADNVMQLGSIFSQEKDQFYCELLPPIRNKCRQFCTSLVQSLY